MLSTYYEPASFLPQVNDGKYSSWQQTIARCKHHSDGGRFIDSHFDGLILETWFSHPRLRCIAQFVAACMCAQCERRFTMIYIDCRVVKP